MDPDALTSGLVRELWAPVTAFAAARPLHAKISRSKQPEMPITIRRASADYFHHAFDDVRWCFVVQRVLTSIAPASRLVLIHNVLNAADVPEHVFVTIFVYEMLHLEFPPANANQPSNMRPPEFSKAERRLCVSYEDSWEWLYSNLPLRRRPRLQCIDVVPGVFRAGQESTRISLRLRI